MDLYLAGLVTELANSFKFAKSELIGDLGSKTEFDIKNFSVLRNIDNTTS